MEQNAFSYYHIMHKVTEYDNAKIYLYTRVKMHFEIRLQDAPKNIL